MGLINFAYIVLMDIIKEIRILASKKMTRKEICEKLSLKYPTLTRYIRDFNIEVVESDMKFGNGRPMFAFDKKPRKRRRRKGTLINTLNIEGGSDNKTPQKNDLYDIPVFDVDKFLKNTYDIVNEPITKSNSIKFERTETHIGN